MKQLQRFVGVVVKINITATAEVNPPPPRFREEMHNHVNKTMKRVKHLPRLFPQRADQFITTTTGHEDTRVSERSSRI